MRRALHAAARRAAVRPAAAMPADADAAAASVAKLRSKMQQAGVDAYVIPTADPHQSEYIAKRYARREYISGFTGSAGTALVTKDKALLWTDGRYWLQAEKELAPTVWTLMRSHEPGVPTYGEWAAAELADGAQLGFDAECVGVEEFERVEKELRKGARKVALSAVGGNLVDAVWADHPAAPSAPVKALEVKYAGQGVNDKLDAVAAELKKVKAQCCVLSALDDIAWLFNLRGADVECNPVFYSYATVLDDGTATLCADEGRLPAGVQEHVGGRVSIRPYADVGAAIDALKGRCAYDEAQTSVFVHQRLAKRGGTVPLRSPATMLKAVKNATEQAGFRACHRRDGIALSRYFMWLEEQLQTKQKVTEVTGATQLETFRKMDPLYVGPSFETISSSGPNAAVIHYRPEAATCRDITTKEIYLCDSGGQYMDGTTDVTRTTHFGTPSAKEREAYTLVLQGHIAIASLTWPEDVLGLRIDAFARAALWAKGLDYGHGTGHGVGHYLNVHEGPHGIGTRHSPHQKPLKAGCVVSNEPGYYEDGAFGIRIENLELVAPRKTKYNWNGKKFLGMERLTLVPLEAKLIDPELLSHEELQWIDRYHAQVKDALAPLVGSDGALGQWLQQRCAPLHRQHKALAAAARAAAATEADRRWREQEEAERKRREVADAERKLAELEQRKRKREVSNALHGDIAAMRAQLAGLESRKKSQGKDGDASPRKSLGGRKSGAQPEGGGGADGAAKKAKGE